MARQNVVPVIPGGGIGADAKPVLDSSGATPTFDRTTVTRWMIGVGGTWIVLTLLVDLGVTSELAVALALVIMGSVVLAYGPDAFKALGISVTSPATPGGA